MSIIVNTNMDNMEADMCNGGSMCCRPEYDLYHLCLWR